MRERTTRATTRAGVGSSTAIALTLGALALGASEASAAPDVACMRNDTGAEIDVVFGPLEGQPQFPGQYWGRLTPHGGQCDWADYGSGAFFFRRAVSPPPYKETPTADAGWKPCPSHTGGGAVYTIRRGLFGMTCKLGGDTSGLEGPSELP